MISPLDHAGLILYSQRVELLFYLNFKFSSISRVSDQDLTKLNIKPESNSSGFSISRIRGNQCKMKY